MTKKELIVEPDSTAALFWHDLWCYRQLLIIFAWRDLVVRYRQTILGVLWAIITPVLTTLILTLVFSKVAKLPSEGDVPYILLVLSGTLAWNLVANGLTQTSVVFIGNAALFSKIYFPRIYMPLSSLSVVLFDFLIGFVILLLLMPLYGVDFSWRISLVPLFVLLAFVLCFGPGLLFATLNVKYRDFRYIIPFLLQVGMYASPVGYGASLVPAEYRDLFSLNPMTGIIGGFRWCLFGVRDSFLIQDLGWSIFITIFFLVIGLLYFRKMELILADVV